MVYWKSQLFLIPPPPLFDLDDRCEYCFFVWCVVCCVFVCCVLFMCVCCLCMCKGGGGEGEEGYLEDELFPSCLTFMIVCVLLLCLMYVVCVC